MNMNKRELTPEQESAVKYEGGQLLVSAAAGSGKTKVLVERLLRHIAGGESNIDEYLVITYTRMAAAELREKILDELSKRMTQEPGNRHLRRQMLRCYGAPIGTIHSFCADILRQNAQLTSLTPDFRVADESEAVMIKAEVLDYVLGKAYESGDQSFRDLVDTLSPGRDDSRLVRMIQDTHAKLQSSPSPRKWIEEQIKLLSMPGISDVSETIWGKHLLDKARATAEFWLVEMARAREEMRTLSEFNNAYGASFEATIAGVEAFLDAIDTGWDAARLAARVDFPRVRPISGYEEFKDIRNKCKTELQKSSEVFENTSDELTEDMRAIAPAMTALFKIVEDFDNAYSEEKRRRGLADFSDLEHLTLNLLRDEETGEPTRLARAVSQKYKEIMVDEYQDVNAVQEFIMQTISSDRKIFMVGDVKQSIYRFRLADPSIFLKKYRSFSDVKTGGEGARILLARNFRSRAGILRAVNFIFENIMSVEFGEMEYSDRERLIHGRQDAEDDHADPAVELDIIDLSQLARDEDEESPAKTQTEARFIAHRIEALIDSGFSIPDGQGGQRPAQYSDIAILLRSVKDKAWQYAQALSEHGIPVQSPSDGGFFETLEISAALSILTVIDNPMQDIPLTTALSGPVYGFTADELAKIRAGSRDSDFYGALVKSAEADSKSAAFLEEMDELRLLAPDMPADRFIWLMYNKTGLPGRVGALKGGIRRRENLMTLLEYARKIESSGYKGLFGFLTYIRGLQEKGMELGQDSAEAAENTVKIISVHKSKGLEFPVVILADTAKRINNRDVQKSCVFHPEFGIGAVRTDIHRRIEYPTLALMAVRSKLTEELMAEELRVLYVALTRAREKLIIVSTFTDAGKEIDRFAKNSRPGKIPPRMLEEVKSMAGWILLPTLQRPEAAFLTGGDGNGIHDDGDRWDIRLVQSADEDISPRRIAETSISPAETEPENIEHVQAQFAFTYPYSEAVNLPSKLTVTELKGRAVDYESIEEAASLPREEKPKAAFERPDFIVERTNLTPAERGTALHLMMQHIDFKKCVGTEGVAGELRRLADDGLLSPEQIEAVDLPRIAGFFESEIGKRVMNASNVRREFKFSLLYPAKRFYPGGGDDEILIQGVIDCFFEEEGELVVVDFKTDYVTRDTVEKKAKQYTPQIEAYADALERITEKHVKERIIYFFAIDDYLGVC
ncbi:MAG: helicase-exonuclease AddAB subunit AddA [Oscillospiraceae bacterium]|nr:helicase-exonuclease AddAB subunit AddA [Oscillospiraceae bacterium]